MFEELHQVNDPTVRQDPIQMITDVLVSDQFWSSTSFVIFVLGSAPESGTGPLDSEIRDPVPDLETQSLEVWYWTFKLQCQQTGDIIHLDCR